GVHRAGAAPGGAHFAVDQVLAQAAEGPRVEGALVLTQVANELPFGAQPAVFHEVDDAAHGNVVQDVDQLQVVARTAFQVDVNFAGDRRLAGQRDALLGASPTRLHQD